MNHDEILARRATLLELQADLQRHAVCESLAVVRATPLSRYVTAGLGMLATTLLQGAFLRRSRALGSLWLIFKLFRRFRRGRGATAAPRPTDA